MNYFTSDPKKSFYYIPSHAGNSDMDHTIHLNIHYTHQIISLIASLFFFPDCFSNSILILLKCANFLSHIFSESMSKSQKTNFCMKFFLADSGGPTILIRNPVQAAHLVGLCQSKVLLNFCVSEIIGKFLGRSNFKSVYSSDFNSTTFPFLRSSLPSTVLSPQSPQARSHQPSG